MVPDQSFCVAQNDGQKCFRNFGHEGGAGVHTMRWGLEQSRNLMTVHIANDAGMDRVVRTFERVGIGTYKPYYSFALGAGETTVQRMVNAYAALANNGVQHVPTLIDYVQDRNGKTIWRHDARKCEGCNASWSNQQEPLLADTREQIIDPRTAYQIVSMLQGVVQRGTAAYSIGAQIPKPLAGKTGTSSDAKDTWFIGFSPDLVAGVFVGFDNPRTLGAHEQGSSVAAPIADARGDIVAAVAVVLPTSQAPASDSVVNALRETARNISRELGASVWPPRISPADD